MTLVSRFATASPRGEAEDGGAITYVDDIALEGGASAPKLSVFYVFGGFFVRYRI